MLEEDALETPVAAAGSRGFFGWWVLASCVLGLVFGASTLLILSIGVFMVPLQAEFGWSRAQVSLCPTITLDMMVVLGPIIGMLVDKFGPRRIMLPAMPLFAAALASLYFVPSDIWIFYSMWAACTLFGAALWSGPYSKVVAAWFEGRLGLALGIAAMGQGLGSALVPIISQALVGRFGWRLAFVGLGGITLIVTFIPACFFLINRPTDKGLVPDGGEDDPARRAARARILALGFGLRECFRQKPFWLAIGGFALAGAFSQVVTQQVPMLVDSGMSPARASYVVGVYGIGAVVGRLAAGYLYDKHHAPYVMIAFLLGPLAALCLYGMGVRGDAAFLIGFILGMGVGAEVDFLGFLVPRYFGRKAYGKIYASILMGYQLGGGFAAAGLGSARTFLGSYAPALWTLAGLTCIAMFLFSQLGPYKHFDRAGEPVQSRLPAAG
jgi:sugar phosphate permease